MNVFIFIFMLRTYWVDGSKINIVAEYHKMLFTDLAERDSLAIRCRGYHQG